MKRTVKQAIVGTVAGALVVLGSATAATDITTTIQGQTGVTDAQAALTVFEVSADNSGGLACTGSKEGGIVRVAAQAKATNGFVPAQSCTVKVVLGNTSSVPITLDSVDPVSNPGALKGWSAVNTSKAGTVIAPSTTSTFTVKVAPSTTVAADLGSGSFETKLHAHAG